MPAIPGPGLPKIACVPPFFKHGFLHYLPTPSLQPTLSCLPCLCRVHWVSEPCSTHPPTTPNVVASSLLLVLSLFVNSKATYISYRLGGSRYHEWHVFYVLHEPKSNHPWVRNHSHGLFDPWGSHSMCCGLHIPSDLHMECLGKTVRTRLCCQHSYGKSGGQWRNTTGISKVTFLSFIRGGGGQLETLV